MLSINADDGQPIDEQHTGIVMDYQHQRITLEEMRARLRACARPATVTDGNTPTPEPVEPPTRPGCCGR